MTPAELEQATDVVLLRLDKAFRRQKDCRYGQLFMNTCMPKLKDPDLFHERDVGKARQLIRGMMLDWQNFETVNDYLMLLEVRILKIEIAQDLDKRKEARLAKSTSY